MAVQFGKAGALQVQLRGPYGSVAIRVAELTLPADGWKGAVSPYSQTGRIEGVTITSKIDLQPDGAQLEKMIRQGCSLAAENNDGLITVYAFGEKPQKDITLQATVTEVQR